MPESPRRRFGSRGNQIAREAEGRHDALKRELAGIDQALAELARREEREREELLRAGANLCSPFDPPMSRGAFSRSGIVSFSLDGLEGELAPGAGLVGLFDSLSPRERRIQDGVRVGRGDPLFRLIETDRLEVAVRVRGAALATGSQVILDSTEFRNAASPGGGGERRDRR